MSVDPEGPIPSRPISRSSFISAFSYNSESSYLLVPNKKKVRNATKKPKSKARKFIRQITRVTENLTYEESEIRLILLGVISSICLLSCATAFALIVNRVSGYYKDSIIVPYQNPDYNSFGFPMPTILVIDHTGSFLTYSPTNNRLERTLPGLNHLPSATKGYGWGYEEDLTQIFCGEYKHHLYFLYPNPQKAVTKYNLNERYHRVITGSYPPNYHSLHSIGIQVGTLFWILLGTDSKPGNSGDIYASDWGNYPTQRKSSLWSFKKETWIEGPNIGHLPFINHWLKNEYCVVATERNTAYILMDVDLQSYNFDLNQWTNHSTREPLQWFMETETLHCIECLKEETRVLKFPTCVFFQEKDYSKHILVQSGIIEVLENDVTWLIQLYDIRKDTWSSSKVTTSKSIRYGGLSTVVNGNVFHILQSPAVSETHLEVNQILMDDGDNYMQQLLFKQGTVNFVSGQERYQTVSVFNHRILSSGSSK